MAALIPGTNGTLKSTTYEAALLEAIILLEIAILAASNAADINFAGATFDDAAGTVVIAANLPVEFLFDNTNGSVKIQATNFVPGSTFSAAADGDIHGESLPEAVLQIAQTLQTKELNSTDTVNRVDITYNSERKFAAVTATLPVFRSILADGSLSITVTPYL